MMKLLTNILLIFCIHLSLSKAKYTEPHCDGKQVIVHLFEWHWDWIADECEKVLGPKGFCGVQVSPPMEHIQGGQWWTRYQPVSYKLESRSGNRGQFESMVQRCNAAGVIVIVDAVINHMTGHGALAREPAAPASTVRLRGTTGFPSPTWTSTSPTARSRTTATPTRCETAI